MIDAISIYNDNIFRYKYDIFKKKKLKNFDIAIFDDYISNDNSCIKLLCKPKEKESFASIVLFIDRTSYAVNKMIIYYSESEEEYKEIGFKEINNKWYLDYSKRKTNTTLFSRWKSNSNSTCEKTVIYNINDSILYNRKAFKTTIDIIAEPIKYHLGDWSDKFWENYNYIPLSDWIKQKIEESNSR
jgi:hypothetical protein